MGRTVPSFRIVIAQEKKEWKPFREALDKKERKDFDDMWDIPRLYGSACFLTLLTHLPDQYIMKAPIGTITRVK
jgi:hypothetical protein